MFIFLNVFKVLSFAATLEVQQSSNGSLDSIENIVIIPFVYMFW